MQFEDPGRIKVFLRDPNKKNFLKICKEVLVLWATKKEMPLYYFKHLYKKDIKNYRDYLAPKEVRRIHASKKLHKSEYTSILNNKLNFALYCERNALSSPALIGHNFGHSFFAGKGIQEISSIDELIHFYTEIFEVTATRAIFFRPLALNGGQGCFKLDRDGFSQQLGVQYENLLKGDYTHTEAITQHPDIDDIYEKSINTLRILTYIDGENVDVVSAFIRIGAGGSVVDNGSSGGLFVGIDQESGTLKRTGYRDMNFGGGEFLKHPDSGFRFENFQVPFFKEACDLAVDGAKYIPDGFIGWDIALTPSGPTIIEGNEDPHVFMSDVAYGGLLKNPHVRKLMDRVK